MAFQIAPLPRLTVFAKFMSEIGRELFGSYRPERHYMRGDHTDRERAAMKAKTINEPIINPDHH